jgi:predicted unusual protein kinase regulating ubiquinone biosynthesis (AarF/ABC1/UbiB family)
MKLAPNHLRRYKDIAILLLKHGNASLAQQADLDLDEKAAKPASDASELADDLEKLGPTFVKIGQLLSTRADLLPPAYLEALTRLQDKVEPVAYEEIEKVVQNELGVRISKAFENFEKTPIGSASLGQVHLATLRDGRTVAVKVQRPGIRQQIVDDLDSLQEIGAFIDEHTDFGKTYEVARVVDQFRGSILRELDYQKEAGHLAELRENLKEFSRLKIPAPVDDYTTTRVLTMEYLSGTKVTKLSGAVLADLDGDVLAEELFRAYLKQILVDGFFHADPHPGNLLLTRDRNLAILDLGMIGRVPQRVRDQLLHMLAGIGEGDGVQTAEAVMSIGTPRDGEIDRVGLISAIEEIVGAGNAQRLSKIEIGTMVLQVTKACALAGLRIPSELTMIGKMLMNLDKVGSTLSPGFNPHQAIRRHLGEISQQRMKETLTSANVLGVLSEMKQFLGQLPSRMNRVFDLVADNKMKIRVDSIDEKALIIGLQKVANRITLGLILAAFIVASSMLARVETSFRIWGYPGLAMVFFLIATIGAVVLFAQILFKDE